jgi:predicted HicB family RNase H-like nuclease
MPESTTIHIRLPRDLMERIRQAAKDDSRSMNNWIQLAIEQRLKEGK